MTVKEFYEHCVANGLEDRIFFIADENRKNTTPVEPEDIIIGTFGIEVYRGDLCQGK